MSEQREAMDQLAHTVKAALAMDDLEAFKELLDPNVKWGAPDSRHPTCQNRDQVLAWYRRGRDSGGRAEVSDTTVHGDKILVSMVLHGTPAADERGGSEPRWQVLTVRDGRVVDIVGFDDRREAAARVGTEIG